MRNQKLLLLEQLDRKLSQYKKLEHVNVPDKGWIYTIRKTLNMTLEQLGFRMGMSRQGVKKMEDRESIGAITLKSLKEAANALDMKVVYGFIPKHSTLDQMVDQRAYALARKIVLRTNHNMKLENQGNSNERITRAIDEMAIELKNSMHKSIWE